MRSLFTMILCIILCSLCLLGTGGKLEAQDSDDVHYVSMIRLIANPDQFNGKIVQVKGYVHLGFEENAVYLHEEDYRNVLLENALHLAISNDLREAPAPYTNHYCIVRGTFKALQGLPWAGSIEKITRLQVDETVRTQ